MATALIIRQVDNYRSEPLRVTRAEPLRIATLTFPGKVFTRSSDDLDDEWVPQGRRLWIKLVIVVGVEPFPCGVVAWRNVGGMMGTSRALCITLVGERAL
jgi:hypothetical protein